MAQRLATADDGRRRCETNDGQPKKKKTSKESVFRQFLFFFFSEEEGTAPSP
jgi:hypothetical protein